MINEFGLLDFASFSDAFRAKEKQQKSVANRYHFYCRQSFSLSVFRVRSVINECCFRSFASFSDALTTKKK